MELMCRYKIDSLTTSPGFVLGGSKLDEVPEGALAVCFDKLAAVTCHTHL